MSVADVAKLVLATHATTLPTCPVCAGSGQQVVRVTVTYDWIAIGHTVHLKELACACCHGFGKATPEQVEAFRRQCGHTTKETV